MLFNKKDKVEKEYLFKQYQLCVEMADKVSQRRLDINKFYVALISLFFSTIVAIFKDKIFSEQYIFIMFLFGFIGFFFCLLWWLHIDSFRKLNSAKFKIINEIEDSLPYKAFDKEWDYLKRGEETTKYIKLTSIEKFVPFFLCIPFLVLLAHSLFYYIKLFWNYLLQ